MKTMMCGIYAGALADNSSVTDLRPTDTADAPYYYTFKVQCTSCRETHANWVGVSRHVGFWLDLTTPISRANWWSEARMLLVAIIMLANSQPNMTNRR
jgi:hypothetical protein